MSKWVPSALLGHMEELDFPGFIFFFWRWWLDLKRGGGMGGISFLPPGYQLEG